MHQWTTGDAPISIHALREEGDHGRRRQHRDRPISIHALREEGDVRNCSAAARSAGYFYPRPPRGGRRFVLSSRSISVIFLSTPSARRATTSLAGAAPEHLDFYPRPPRGGRRILVGCNDVLNPFLSTPSARRATWKSCCSVWRTGYFYPRPPRGGRRSLDGLTVTGV